MLSIRVPVPFVGDNGEHLLSFCPDTLRDRITKKVNSSHLEQIEQTTFPPKKEINERAAEYQGILKAKDLLGSSNYEQLLHEYLRRQIVSFVDQLQTWGVTPLDSWAYFVQNAQRLMPYVEIKFTV